MASVLKVNGAFNTGTKQIQAGHWQVAGGFLEKLIPGIRCAELVAAGDVQGAITNLTHRGDIALTTCRTAGLKPFDLKASWNGQHQRL